MSRPRSIIILTVLVAATVLLSPWKRDLYIGDEVRYAQVVSEMRNGGHLLVPHLGGEPYSHKPPLHFWSILSLTYVFGESSIWPFVLPSIAAFIALLFIVRALARRLAGPSTSLLAAFVFATFYLSWGLAQTARMDLQYVAFISIAVLFIHRHLTGSDRRGLLIAGCATGIAILIKGPMAFVIVVALLLFERMRKGRLPRGPYFSAAMIAAAIPLLWLLPAILAGGSGYGRELLVEQNVGRAISAWTHGEPPWFYLLHAPGTFFPWFVLFVIALLAIYRRDSVTPAKEGDDDNLRFCVSWFLAVLIPFSILSGKLDVYMLPACVPIAIIIARFLTSGEAGRWHRRAVFANVIVMGFLALLGSALLAAAPHIPKTSPELRMLDDPRVSGLFVLILAASFVALLVTFARQSGRLLRSSIALALAALSPMVYVMIMLMPALNAIGSTEPLVRALARMPYEGEQIALFKAPYLWSRSMPQSLRGVRYLDEEGLDEAWTKPPELIAVQSGRAHLLGPRLQDYIRFDRVRIKSRDFDVYRRR